MTDIQEQVRAFHKAAELTDPTTPMIPSDDVVRLRARLIAEEFVETLRCMFDDTNLLDNIHSDLSILINNSPVQVEIVGMCDGLADVDYVVEGTRQVFGIDGRPIAAEVQRSNMDKFRDGVKRRADGKIIKPADWTPPNIKAELIKQGMKE